MEIKGKLDRLLYKHGNLTDARKTAGSIISMANLRSLDVSEVNKAAGEKNYLFGPMLEVITSGMTIVPQFKLVSTGKFSSRDGKELFVMFERTGEYQWVGGYINSLEGNIARIIFQKNLKLFAKEQAALDAFVKTASSSTVISQEPIKIISNNMPIFMQANISSIAEDIYPSILKPAFLKQNDSIAQLADYLGWVAARFMKSLEQGNCNGYQPSTTLSRTCLVHTGLVDTYFQSLSLIAYQERNDVWKLKLVNSPKEISNAELDSAMKYLKPWSVHNEQVNMLPATQLDQNIRYGSQLKHIIQERRGRFPAEVQSFSDNLLESLLQASIIHAVKMEQVVPGTIPIMYNPREGVAQYLVPLHIASNWDDAPDLVVIMDVRSGTPNMSTVLELPDAIKNVQYMQPYAMQWYNKEA